MVPPEEDLSPLPEMIYYFIWSTAQAAHPSWYFRYRAYGVWWALLPIRCLLFFRFASDKPVWIHPPGKIWVSMAAKQLRHQSGMPVSAGILPRETRWLISRNPAVISTCCWAILGGQLSLGSGDRRGSLVKLWSIWGMGINLRHFSGKLNDWINYTWKILILKIAYQRP